MNFTLGPGKEQKLTVPIDASSSNGENMDLKDSKFVQILIMGDSIGKGTGDEKALGIGGNLSSLLKNQTPKDIKIENLAIDGYRIDNLLEQVQSGRVDKAIAISNVILLSIGGNDLRQIQALKDIEKVQTFQEEQGRYLSELKEIIQRLRSINKEAQLVVLGLYNPFIVDNSSDNIWYVETWNYNTQLLLAKDDKAVFVPTYEIFKNNLDRFISEDKLHPNTMGYQTISFLIGKSIENVLGKFN